MCSHLHRYYAAASFADAQIGKVLAQLKASGLEDNTVVGLFGDHGWHIGENNEWAKHTAMTWANNAPLLFAIPGGTGNIVSVRARRAVHTAPAFASFYRALRVWGLEGQGGGCWLVGWWCCMFTVLQANTLHRGGVAFEPDLRYRHRCCALRDTWHGAALCGWRWRQQLVVVRRVCGYLPNIGRSRP